jgi:hypothetical protein
MELVSYYICEQRIHLGRLFLHSWDNARTFLNYNCGNPLDEVADFWTNVSQPFLMNGPLK